MALQASILTPSDIAPVQFTVTAAASSAEQIATSKLFAVCATDDCHVRFGNSGMGASDATYWRVPQNQTQTFDIGTATDRIRVFNPTVASITVTILPLYRS